MRGRGGPAFSQAPSLAAYPAAIWAGTFVLQLLRCFGGFDGFYHFPSPRILPFKQPEKPTAAPELLLLGIYLTPVCHAGHIFPPNHPVKATATFVSVLMILKQERKVLFR